MFWTREIIKLLPFIIWIKFLDFICPQGVWEWFVSYVTGNLISHLLVLRACISINISSEGIWYEQTFKGWMYLCLLILNSISTEFLKFISTRRAISMKLYGWEVEVWYISYGQSPFRLIIFSPLYSSKVMRLSIGAMVSNNPMAGNSFWIIKSNRNGILLIDSMVCFLAWFIADISW